jgi:hypothetical protein
MDQPPAPPILTLLHATMPLPLCVSPPHSSDHTLLHLQLPVGRRDVERDKLALREELIGRGPPRCEEHGFELVDSMEMEAEDLLDVWSMASSLLQEKSSSVGSVASSSQLREGPPRCVPGMGLLSIEDSLTLMSRRVRPISRSGPIPNIKRIFAIRSRPALALL